MRVAWATLRLLMDAVQQEERRQGQDMWCLIQSAQHEPCMRINWVKGEGPTLNQQLPGRRYQMKYFWLRTVNWSGT